MAVRMDACRHAAEGVEFVKRNPQHPPTPPPGCFAERAWICLIAKGLSFFVTTKSLQEYENKGARTVASGEWRERAKAAPTRRCVCVNAVDKGVSGRFGVPLGLARGKKATNKGLTATARPGVPLGFARGKKAVDTPRLRSGQEGLMAPGDCGNKFSGREEEGLVGDTVQQNLSFSDYRSRWGLNSPWRSSFVE